MKYLLILTIALCCCLLFSADAAPKSRRKRSLGWENCPPNTSDEECTAYAKEKSMGSCLGFGVGEKTIGWEGCGAVECGGLLRITEEDLSKPYPHCCRRCELDPSISDTL